MDTESAICADSLTKVYRSGNGTVVVFDKLFLRVARGERLAIIGASGAGKSTLLHLLGGLDKPDSGHVVYFDRSLPANLAHFSDQQLADFRNRHLGFVWQNPSLLPEFSALENVMMPLLIRGVTPGKAALQARRQLDGVGLSARAAHRAGELSGGEQQRVSLARALITQPQVLLADEPTGSLDYRTSEAIFELLNQVHQAYALTSIFVTHNHSLAARCDRVLELDKGTLRPFPATQLAVAGQQPFFVPDATRLDGGNYV